MKAAALIGAGIRGTHALASYALQRPDEIQFIAVAEPDEERRAKFAKLHNIPAERQYSSWEQLLDNPPLCEALLICTQDRMHYEPTMKALEQGYRHILLEKPMSPDPLETLEIAEEVKRLGSSLSITHVLRYSTYFSALKKLLEQEVIGRIVTVQWNENVGYWHQVHSFVRGNWNNSETTSPMILQKCCHDMDILQYLIGSACTKVSSFGSLTYFRQENAPEGSTERCIDGCKVEHECPFSALKWYYNEKPGWPQNAVTLEPTLAAREKALREGPYGRCVYRCDNNVVDHQVVNLEFENDVTVAFTMSGLTMENTRTFKFMGTMGEIRGHYDKNEIEIHYFSGRKETIIPETVSGGHGGADTMIMKEFVELVRDGQAAQSKTNAMESARSHLIAFAAEESRVRGQTIVMEDYIAELKAKSNKVGAHHG